MNRELSARRSLGEARRYREYAAYLVAYAAEGEPHYDAERDRERITNNVRAALAHELWAARQRDEISAADFTVGEAMLGSWHGSDLSTFLAAIRVVAAE